MSDGKFDKQEIINALNGVAKRFVWGGRYLEVMRKWMQNTFHNGSTVRWGSTNEFLTGTSLTPFAMEELADRVKAAVLEEVKERLMSELQDMQRYKG